jgi:hypothetical protein
MSETIAEPLLPPAITCFPDRESKELDDLVLIAFCLARTRARGRSRWAGRATFAECGATCI